MEYIKRLTKQGKVFLAVFAACIGLVAEASAKEINIGVLRFTSHSAAFIAYEKGYFKEAGLTAKLVPFQAAAPMAVAIASGDIDYGVTAISGALVNLAEKGIGAYIQMAGSLFAIDRLLAGIIILSCMGLIANWLIGFTERKLLKWRNL